MCVVSVVLCGRGASGFVWAWCQWFCVGVVSVVLRGRGVSGFVCVCVWCQWFCVGVSVVLCGRDVRIAARAERQRKGPSKRGSKRRHKAHKRPLVTPCSAHSNPTATQALAEPSGI